MKASSILALAAIAAAGLAAPAGAQPGSGVTADWLAGTWADRPDCSGAVHFLADGRFVTKAGGEGRWRIERSEIVLSDAQGREARRMPVVRLGQNRLRSGQVVSYRCEGRSDPRG